MSKFEVADEAIIALWYGLARECNELGVPGGLSHTFLEVARGNFFRMLANFPQHVLSGVAHLADGTSEPVLRIVVSDGYKFHLIRSAKRFHHLVSH